MEHKGLDEQWVWGIYGANQKADCLTIGMHTSFQFRRSPRRLLFGMARYKFAKKMIGDGKDILELGCSDGFYTCVLAENSHSVLGIDFDKEVIEWAIVNMSKDNLRFRMGNFLNEEYGKYDAVVAFDVIEHTLKEHEDLFMQRVCHNLSEDGIAIIGTPNILAMKHSSPEIRNAHVNEYSAERLENLMEKYFNNVFIFSQNDEVVHTGFAPMAHYLIAVCCHKKEC